MPAIIIFRMSSPTRTAQSQRVGYSERSCKPVMQLKSVHPAKMLRRVNERARISSDRSHALASVTPTARDYPRCLSRGARERGDRPSLWDREKRTFRVALSRVVRARTEMVIDAHRKLNVKPVWWCRVVKESSRGGPARVER